MKLTVGGKGMMKPILESGYAYDDTKLDFEFYDERCHYRQDTVMDIYVPVTQKAGA